jgi:hypothetical protein
MLENAREELQRKLEEAKEKRKLLRGRAKDSASESRRRRASKLMETTMGASMSKVKAKLAEIESLREQLDREVRRSKEERQGAAAGLPYTPTTERIETEGERMLTRKRRREANNGRGIESNLGLAERLHKLLETTANLAKELSEQHDAIRALPRFGSSAASPPLPDLAPTVALTSSLLSACLLSMTTHSLRSEDTEGELTPSPGTSASTSPILLRRSLSPAAQSPVPVTFTYPVPTLSSQEFIKSLEALTCSSSSSLLSTSPSPTFSSSLGGSLSFTIPCAPPPSLASSLSFTSLPPPLPTFTDAGGDGVPSPSSSSSSTTVFFPPPPLPTLPVSSAFPASFPYVDYIVGVQPGGSEAATSYTPVVPSTSPSDAVVGDDVEIRTAKPNGQKRRRGRGTIVKPVERDGGGSQTNEEDEWRVEMQVGDGSDEEEGGDNDETPRNINANTDTNDSSIGDQDESEEAPVKRKRGRPRRGQEKKTRR